MYNFYSFISMDVKKRKQKIVMFYMNAMHILSFKNLLHKKYIYKCIDPHDAMLYERSKRCHFLYVTMEWTFFIVINHMVTGLNIKCRTKLNIKFLIIKISNNLKRKINILQGSFKVFKISHCLNQFVLN